MLCTIAYQLRASRRRVGANRGSQRRARELNRQQLELAERAHSRALAARKGHAAEVTEPASSGSSAPGCHGIASKGHAAEIKATEGGVLAGTSLGEERVEGIAPASNGLIGRHLAVRLDAVLKTEKLPACISNLHASLANVDADRLTHCVEGASEVS